MSDDGFDDDFDDGFGFYDDLDYQDDDDLVFIPFPSLEPLLVSSYTSSSPFLVSSRFLSPPPKPEGLPANHPSYDSLH